MELIYITDPMCSWCYGFSPEIRKVKEHFSDYSFRLVMGGLRPYNTERIDNMQEFLREHWEQVNFRSGQPFNYGILKDSNFIYDTEPPARATVTVRHLNADKEFDFFSEVQKAFYLQNHNTNEIVTYLNLIDQLNLNIDHSLFKELFLSDRIRAETQADFKFATSLGVRGFPTLILKSKSNYRVVTRGYQKADDIIETIESYEGK